jgi:hypothetical protein
MVQLIADSAFGLYLPLELSKRATHLSNQAS